MVINGLWLCLFMADTSLGFALGLLDIIVILASNIWIMITTSTSELNAVEAISLGGGFSIYAGWVTAATILNAAFLLKSLGLADPDIPFGFNEENLSQIILWVAFVIYNLVAYKESNPLYGLVYIWVTLAIKKNLEDLHPETTALISDLTTITVI